ncbi:MAG: hypothetical protein LBI29_00655 [Rickettsiales bacterium]|jgi:hypothetical protein|nr:hypothetical protein [Rickettsiales bacterium]
MNKNNNKRGFMGKYRMAVVLFTTQVWAIGIGVLRAEKKAVKPGPGGSSIEQIAKNILEEVEKKRPQGRVKDSGIVYMVDFDNTIHTQEGPIRIEPIIDEDVLMKSLLDRADGSADEYSEKIRDFLVARAVELGNYRIDSFATIQELFRDNKNFRKDLSKSVGVYFEKKATPNQRISYLLEFGCSRDQIESNYTNMSKNYTRYYTGIKQNPAVVEIISQLLHAKKKVVILTDNSEANVLVGFRYMKLEETIEKRLAELGTTLDPKIPIIAGETDINGILPIDLNMRPLIPIISMFKRRPKISEHFFEISTKKCSGYRKIVERELKEKYDIDTKNKTFVMIDDNPAVLDNLAKQGIVPVLVEGARLTVGSPGKPTRIGQ